MLSVNMSLTTCTRRCWIFGAVATRAVVAPGASARVCYHTTCVSQSSTELAGPAADTSVQDHTHRHCKNRDFNDGKVVCSSQKQADQALFLAGNLQIARQNQSRRKHGREVQMDKKTSGIVCANNQPQIQKMHDHLDIAHFSSIDRSMHQRNQCEILEKQARNASLMRQSASCRQTFMVKQNYLNFLGHFCALNQEKSAAACRSLRRTFGTDCASHDSSVKKNRHGGSDGAVGDDDENMGEAEMEDWVHPDQRPDAILDTDPDLRSMLRELVLDFDTPSDTHAHDEESGKSDQADGKDKQEPQGWDSRDIDEGSGRSSDTSNGRGVTTTGVKNSTDIVGDSMQPIGTDTAKSAERRPVFSIDDLVALLREENAQDICVIAVPKEKQYVDFFVVVSGRSPRHLKAMAAHINQQYKQSKTRADPFLFLEGQDADDWLCLDFGNIVLHLMSDEMRELYELEKLWTLGPEYDEQLRRIKDHDSKMKETLDAIHVDVSEPEISDADPDSGPHIKFAR